MELKHYNYEIKSLTEALAIGGTSITINNTDNLPTLGVTDFMTLTLIHLSTGSKEIVTVTDVTGDVLTVTRGVEGTTPVAYIAGDLIVSFITSGMLDYYAPLHFLDDYALLTDLDAYATLSMDLVSTTGAITITDAHVGAVVEVTGDVTIGAVSANFQCTVVNVSGSPVGLSGATLGNDLEANISAGGVINVAKLTAGVLVTGQMEV